jgi:hypothetical protein
MPSFDRGDILVGCVEFFHSTGDRPSRLFHRGPDGSAIEILVVDEGDFFNRGRKPRSIFSVGEHLFIMMEDPAKLRSYDLSFNLLSESGTFFTSGSSSNSIAPATIDPEGNILLLGVEGSGDPIKIKAVDQGFNILATYTPSSGTWSRSTPAPRGRESTVLNHPIARQRVSSS